MHDVPQFLERLAVEDGQYCHPPAGGEPTGAWHATLSGSSNKQETVTGMFTKQNTLTGNFAKQNARRGLYGGRDKASGVDGRWKLGGGKGRNGGRQAGCRVPGQEYAGAAAALLCPGDRCCGVGA